MPSPDARLYVELAVTLTIELIYLSPMCYNLATNVFLPFLFLFFGGVVFALMSFLLAMLQSCSVAVSNQIPSDVCVRGNGPTCSCVMYINVALYGIYNEPED